MRNLERYTVYVDEDLANSTGCFYNKWDMEYKIYRGHEYVIGEFSNGYKYEHAGLLGDIERLLVVI